MATHEIDFHCPFHFDHHGLRRDPPQQTAYPSTFLIDSRNKVFFSKISKTHGGGTTTTEVLEELKK